MTQAIAILRNEHRSQAISIIKDEHRSMAAVLKGLISHVADVKSGRVAPDFDLCAAMFEYIHTVPERLHHPKEDEYLFRYLRERSPESHAVLDDLEAQHARCAEHLATVRRQLDAYRAGGDVDGFEQALAAYAQFQWEHMRREEEHVLPLAERDLTADDWRTIDAAFAANRDRSW